MPTRTMAGRCAGAAWAGIAPGTDRWPGLAARLNDGDAAGAGASCSQNGCSTLRTAGLPGSRDTAPLDWLLFWFAGRAGSIANLAPLPCAA